MKGSHKRPSKKEQIDAAIARINLRQYICNVSIAKSETERGVQFDGLRKLWRLIQRRHRCELCLHKSGRNDKLALFAGPVNGRGSASVEKFGHFSCARRARWKLVANLETGKEAATMT